MRKQKIDPEDSYGNGADPMNKQTAKRKRRREKLRIKNISAVRAHREKTGRTGAVWKKKNHGKGKAFSRSHPNAPFSGWGTR